MGAHLRWVPGLPPCWTFLSSLTKHGCFNTPRYPCPPVTRRGTTVKIQPRNFPTRGTRRTKVARTWDRGRRCGNTRLSRQRLGRKAHAARRSHGGMLHDNDWIHTRCGRTPCTGILLTPVRRSSKSSYTSHPEWLRDWPEEATATPQNAGCQLLPHELCSHRCDARASAGRDEEGSGLVSPFSRPIEKGFAVFGTPVRDTRAQDSERR